MKNKKKYLILSVSFVLLSVLFTILVKFCDVQQIGPDDSKIGLATINQFFSHTIGVNMVFYHITDWLGLIPIFMVFGYVVLGIVQLVKRKNIKKVDKEIFILGVFYLVVIIVYIFFEKVIINYRPILMDGYLEASYPSSHTLMALCLCGSSIIINKKLFENKISKIINIISMCVMSITVIGRLISGVHWFTDIVGGLIISSALLLSFYTLINMSKKQNDLDF